MTTTPFWAIFLPLLHRHCSLPASNSGHFKLSTVVWSFDRDVGRWSLEEEAAMSPRIWHKVSGMSGVAALCLGAYGAHGFKPRNPTYKDVWATGSLYHLVHSAALLAAPMTARPHIFGSLLTAGILSFSGTCYTVAYLEDRKYGFLAPFGGFALIAAWGSLCF